MNQLEEFKALGLSDDILTAIAKKGFETPSAIQSLTIPHLLTTDKDIIAQAQTGTGKTAAFGLPIIQMLTSRRNIPQAIVLVPTRELALQVTQELISFNTHDLSIAPIYGGASMTEQLRRLKKGIDIVVGTPGRILDHIRRGTLDLSAIAYLVLEAFILYPVYCRYMKKAAMAFSICGAIFCIHSFFLFAIRSRMEEPVPPVYTTYTNVG